MNETLIRDIPLFASLPDEEIARLAEDLEVHEFSEGSLLMKEDEPASSLYILLDGEVEIIKAMGTEDERLLSIRKPGTMLGEIALISDEGLHTATVRAKTPVRTFLLAQDEFHALLKRQPGFAFEMLRTLSHRLDQAENLTIQDLRRKNYELTVAYKRLEAVQALMIEKERLERELEVAREIQFSILPEAPPSVPGYSFGACIQPMRAVGGDFYDFIPLEGGRLGIAIGDVSNHGVPASLFMAITVTLLRAEARRGGSPKEVLREVNRQLLEMNRSGMFITILYGVLDTATGDFTYVRAGHEQPIVFNQDGKQRKLAIKTGQLMGILDDPILEEQTVHLEPGSVLLLCTDGLKEASDREGEPFGVERLQSALASRRTRPVQEICNQLIEEVAQLRGGVPQQDDIAVVIVQVAESARS